MLELADIFRDYGPAYRQTYGAQMLPSHHQAMWDIEYCRTAMMGGDMYYCPRCRLYHYSYHSCGNRHCPKCESDRADTWRDTQLEKLLPVPYFLVTCTLPHTLNPLAHAHQKLIYRLLFTASARALQALAGNPKYVGGLIGMVGVLHTWDRSMGYHLHVHYLIPAGGWDRVTGEWKAAHPKFLVPCSALREVFRAKFRDALKVEAPEVFALVPPETWQVNWVVHVKPVGDGRTALKYLAPYIYRVALSNRRLLSLKDGQVTFRYKPHNQGWKTMTLDVMRFIGRFLQHVLPKGFQKVRYYGFLHPSAHTTFSAIQAHFAMDSAAVSEQADEAQEPLEEQEVTAPQSVELLKTPICCPHCGGPLAYIGRVAPQAPKRGPP
jgi:hypothetical protein